MPIASIAHAEEAARSKADAAKPMYRVFVSVSSRFFW